MDFDHNQLRWTSRKDLCERLDQLVSNTPPDHPELDPGKPVSLRWSAAELLLVLSKDGDSEYPLRLLRRADEEPWLHQVALGLLLRSGAVIPPEDLALFLGRDAHGPELLLLCRSDALCRVARAWIETRSPSERAELLIRLNSVIYRVWGWFKWRCDQPPQDVREDLYRHWADWDRLLPDLEEPDEQGFTLNLQVAAMFSDRAEARQALSRYLGDGAVWSKPEFHRPACLDPKALALLLATMAPPLSEFPLETLTVGCYYHPTENRVRALINHYGLEELLLELDTRIRQYSVRVPNLSETRHLMSIIRVLPGGSAEERLRSLAESPDLHPQLRTRLQSLRWDRLFERNREQAVHEVITCTEGAGKSRSVLAAALYRTGTTPTHTDRRLFRWAVESERTAFAGIVGMEALGEDGLDWRRTLERLAESPVTSVRLLASAALTRRGDAKRLAEIERCACAFPASENDCEGDHHQGLALRLLGELDGARYAGLMQAVLAQHFPWEHNGSPDQEAAFVLAQLATPAAVTALLRAYFTGSDYLRRRLRFYIPAAVARLEGEDVPLTNQVSIWRYARFPP